MLSSTFSKSLACCIVALLAVSAPANTIFSASLNGASENPPPNEIIEGLLRDFEVGEALKRYGDGPEHRRNLEGGQAYAKIHDATFSSDKMPLAFVFLIVGLVAGYSLRVVNKHKGRNERLSDRPARENCQEKVVHEVLQRRSRPFARCDSMMWRAITSLLCSLTMINTPR